MANFNATYFDGGDLYSGVSNPAPAEYFVPSTVTVINVANIRYYQRVYSAAPTSAWCYYDTLNALNPSPASGATSPPWVGPISDPQVIATVPVP